MTCTLAVACENDSVCPDFGNSPEFAVFEILLCGALNASVRSALEATGIEAVEGQTGDVIQVTGAFLMKLVRAGK